MHTIGNTLVKLSSVSGDDINDSTLLSGVIGVLDELIMVGLDAFSTLKQSNVIKHCNWPINCGHILRYHFVRLCCFHFASAQRFIRNLFYTLAQLIGAWIDANNFLKQREHWDWSRSALANPHFNDEQIQLIIIRQPNSLHQSHQQWEIMAFARGKRVLWHVCLRLAVPLLPLFIIRHFFVSRENIVKKSKMLLNDQLSIIAAIKHVILQKTTKHATNHIATSRSSQFVHYLWYSLANETTYNCYLIVHIFTTPFISTVFFRII